MTDNELRAHDLAIATIPFIQGDIKEAVREAMRNGKSLEEALEENKFDIYQEYMNAYSILLQSFEKSFPTD